MDNKRYEYLELVAKGLIKLKESPDPNVSYTIDMTELHKVLRAQGKLKK